MSLDVSDAIALAKDLLQTSQDYRPHDPEMAAEFANRAYQICEDLGIERSLVGEEPAPAVEAPSRLATEKTKRDGGGQESFDRTPADLADDDARQTSDQLRDLLQQQARVLQNVREAEAVVDPKPKKRGFRLFGRPDQPFGALQSA